MLKKRHRNDFVVKPKWFCSHSENGLMKNAQTAQSMQQTQASQQMANAQQMNAQSMMGGQMMNGQMMNGQMMKCFVP